MIKLSSDFDELLVPSTCSVLEALDRLNKTARRILLVQDLTGFVGVCNDGDLRRGILSGLELSSDISTCLQREPYFATSKTPVPEIEKHSRLHGLSAVPVVENERVVGVYFQSSSESTIDASLIIMAGGKGLRMQPHTLSIPKPMLEVAGKPMLQHLVEDAAYQGIRNVVISVGFLGNMIKDYFGDGSSFGITVSYLEEEEPMGTFGSITTVMEPLHVFGERFFLRNGDVLAMSSYQDMLLTKVDEGFDFLVTSREYAIENPYGVIQHDIGSLRGIEEKPIYRSQVNAGIYLFKTLDLEIIENTHFMNTTDYINLLLKSGKKGKVYSLEGPWMDVGRPNDLQEAQSKFSRGLRND